MTSKGSFIRTAAAAVFFIVASTPYVTAQVSPDYLIVNPGDAYIEFLPGSEGFDLYIRAQEGLGSIMITESTADPEKKLDSYSYRAWDYNPINGDERRILDGEFIEPERPLYFLIDSSPEENALLGSAFRIYVPFQLTYGYPWSREGQVDVHRGTFLNIRTFERPYGDYRGAWGENPFVLSMKELPPPPKAPEVGPVQDITEALDMIDEIFSLSGGNVDVVLAVDTTISMKDDIGFLRENLVPLVRNRVEGFTSYRIGMVLYRDYKEAYLTRSYAFMDDLDDIQLILDQVTVSGGRDLPEAVNESLYAALTEFPWEAPERMIIQVGDADPHPEPRGEITPTMVEEEATALGVSIFPIRLPDDN